MSGPEHAGWPPAPFTVDARYHSPLIGLDVCLYVMDVMYREFCDSKYRPCPLLRKMAEHPACDGVRTELEAVAGETWDVEALDAAVRESQSARRLVSAALATGARTSWDFQPMRDATKLYFRESGDIQASYSGTVG